MSWSVTCTVNTAVVHKELPYNVRSPYDHRLLSSWPRGNAFLSGLPPPPRPIFGLDSTPTRLLILSYLFFSSSLLWYLWPCSMTTLVTGNLNKLSILLLFLFFTVLTSTLQSPPEFRVDDWPHKFLWTSSTAVDVNSIKCLLTTKDWRELFNLPVPGSPRTKVHFVRRPHHGPSCRVRGGDGLEWWGPVRCHRHV